MFSPPPRSETRRRLPFDLEAIIEAVGYVGLFVIVFVETGLFVGFLLPGDSLLITAGIMAQRGHFRLEIMIPLLIVAAITGDQLGYAIGREMGARLFARPDSRFFKRSHLERAAAFYAKHGGKTIVLARFLAIIRSFAPAVAGAAGMPYRRFVFFNVLGGLGWVASTVLLGYFVGHAVPNLDALLFVVVGGIILVSVLPAAWHLWRSRSRSASAR